MTFLNPKGNLSELLNYGILHQGDFWLYPHSDDIKKKLNIKLIGLKTLRNFKKNFMRNQWLFDK